MLVGVAFLTPSFPPSRTQVFYIIKRQNCVYFCNRVYLSRYIPKGMINCYVYIIEWCGNHHRPNVLRQREDNSLCLDTGQSSNMKPRFLSNFKIKYKCQMDFSIVASGPPKISCRRVIKIEEFQGVDIFYFRLHEKDPISMSKTTKGIFNL